MKSAQAHVWLPAAWRPARLPGACHIMFTYMHAAEAGVACVRNSVTCKPEGLFCLPFEAIMALEDDVKSRCGGSTHSTAVDAAQ